MGGSICRLAQTGKPADAWVRVGPEAVGCVPEARVHVATSLSIAAEQEPKISQRALVDASADQVEEGPFLQIVGLEPIVRHEVGRAPAQADHQSARIAEIFVGVLRAGVEQYAF